MAVTVVTKLGVTNAPIASVVIEDANGIELGDGGHLVIKKTGGSTSQTLAVFAPLTWVIAHKDDGVDFG